MPGRFSVESVFKAVDRVSAPVSRMQNRIQKFTRTTRNGVDRASRSFKNLGRDIKGAALVGAASLASLIAVMMPVVNTTAQFEQSIVNAAAKFPGLVKNGKVAEDQLIKLENVARKVGGTTEFTASQSAEALNFLAMAGFSAEQAIAALPKVVDLATASQTDLATASDIATDSLGAFNLATKDPVQNSKNLQRIIDVMAKTTVTANTNMEQLMESVKQGAPVFTSAGQSLETYMALVGEMANAGIKASDSVTTMKNIITRLTGPVGKAAKILKRLGVDTKDADGNMRDVVDILEDLDKGLSGLGSADRAAAIKEIFGKIPLAGVNVLLGAGTDKLRKYRRELEMASGASAEMAKVMRNTLHGRLNALDRDWETFRIFL
jgi:TP901 family phage tail tape measure protein